MSGSVSLTALASYAAVASAGYTIFKGLSGDKGGGTPAAAAPAISSPTKLPIPENTGQAAEKASLIEMQRRRGRASTILTETSDTLGA